MHQFATKWLSSSSLNWTCTFIKSPNIYPVSFKEIHSLASSTCVCLTNLLEHSQKSSDLHHITSYLDAGSTKDLFFPFKLYAALISPKSTTPSCALLLFSCLIWLCALNRLKAKCVSFVFWSTIWFVQLRKQVCICTFSVLHFTNAPSLTFYHHLIRFYYLR